MKKKLISLLVTAAMIMTFLPVTVSAQESINIGEYVQMGTYYGEPILWRCVDIDENGPLMLSDKIICIKPFDAKGDNTSGSHGRGYNDGQYRKRWGSNYWADSNMRCWLNSDASAGNVNWTCGNAPTEDKVWNGYNEYADEAGFLTNFTAGEKKAIKPVTQKSLLDGYEHNSNSRDSNYHIYDININNVLQNYDTALSEQVTDSVFLLDVKQVNAVYNNSSILGDNYYVGEPTQQCVSNSEYVYSGLKSGNKWHYWLRSPDATSLYSNGVRYVHSVGIVDNDIAGNYYLGVRPAFYLNLLSSSFVSGNGSEASPYTVESNAPTPQITEEPTQKPVEVKTVTTSFGATVSEWAAPEIEEAFKNNLIPEVMLDFDMTKKVNRGEFAAIALQLYDTLTKSETGLPASCPFIDISGDINEKAIMKAFGIGVTDGISNTTFEPLRFITREQLATMLCRVIKKYSDPNWSLANDSDYYMDTSGTVKFADDGDISDWAKPSVYFMSKFNIVQGVDDTHFAPKNTTTQQEASDYASATREQAIILAERIFKISDVWSNGGTK